MQDDSRAKLTKPDGHKARSAATTEQVLAAAEEVFLVEGFERAQIETIAKAAGRTKGAVYTHFKNKDDLFLALFESRTLACVERLRKLLAPINEKKKAVEAFKKFVLELTAEKTFPLLALEFKLYALRRPEFRERWLRTYEMIRVSKGDYVRKKLFGSLSTSKLKAADTNLAAVGPLLSSLLLESYFETNSLSERRLANLLDRILSALLVVS